MKGKSSWGISVMKKKGYSRAKYAFLIMFALAASGCCGRRSTLRPEVSFLGVPGRDVPILVLRNAEEFFEVFGFRDPMYVMLLWPDVAGDTIVLDTLPSADEFFSCDRKVGMWTKVGRALIEEVKRGAHPYEGRYRTSGEVLRGAELIEEYLAETGEDSVYVGVLEFWGPEGRYALRNDGSLMIAYAQSVGMYLRHFWCSSHRYYVSDPGIVVDRVFEATVR